QAFDGGVHRPCGKNVFHVGSTITKVATMPIPKLSDIERQIMEAFWTRGPLCIREVQETFPVSIRPAYTTVQTVVYRLENKKALRRIKKISNAHIFEAA